MESCPPPRTRMRSRARGSRPPRRMRRERRWTRDLRLTLTQPKGHGSRGSSCSHCKLTCSVRCATSGSETLPSRWRQASHGCQARRARLLEWEEKKCSRCQEQEGWLRLRTLEPVELNPKRARSSRPSGRRSSRLCVARVRGTARYGEPSTSTRQQERAARAIDFQAAAKAIDFEEAVRAIHLQALTGASKSLRPQGMSRQTQPQGIICVRASFQPSCSAF